jgi:hypothetical protein
MRTGTIRAFAASYKAGRRTPWTKSPKPALIGNLVFAIEECPYFSTANSQPRGLDLLSRMGRHSKIDLVWTAQRMAEVSRRHTSATDVFVLFRFDEPRDLDALADRCGSDVALKVSQLALHCRLVYDVSRAKLVTV